MNRRLLIAAVVVIGALAAFLASTPVRHTNPKVQSSEVSDPATDRSADEWDRADDEITRLSPDKIPGLPAAVLARLLDLDCTIPQARGEPGPHNVITGRFMSRVSSDWAVLCSRHHASSILVFPEGAVESMIELNARSDRGYLQGLGAGQIGFSRLINVAGPEHIVAYFKAFSGPTPPRLDHDGIDDIFVGKLSSVHYWHAGRWLELQGAD